MEARVQNDVSGGYKYMHAFFKPVVQQGAEISLVPRPPLTAFFAAVPKKAEGRLGYEARQRYGQVYHIFLPREAFYSSQVSRIYVASGYQH